MGYTNEEQNQVLYEMQQRNLEAEKWNIDNKNAYQEELYSVKLVTVLDAKLSKDGNKFCYLLGENQIEGCVGFGKTRMDAAKDFSNNYYNEGK